MTHNLCNDMFLLQPDNVFPCIPQLQQDLFRVLSELRCRAAWERSSVTLCLLRL